MHIAMPDSLFLDHVTLSLPEMKHAAALRKSGDEHAAALEAARVMFFKPFPHQINESDIPELAEIIRTGYPRQVDFLQKLADNYFLKTPLAGLVCGDRPEFEMAFYRAPAGSWARRGAIPHMLARLYHITGKKKYLTGALRHVRRLLKNMKPLPDGWDAGAFIWHPNSVDPGHDPGHIAEKLCHALPYLRAYLSPEDALTFAKAMLALAEFCFRTCKLEVMFNIPLHMQTGYTLTGICFPQFKQAREWVTWGYKRLISDCTGAPLATEDGYFGEGLGYQCVNHNLIFINLRYLEASGRTIDPRLRAICEKSFEFAVGMLRNDGKYPLFGDTSTQSPHEHHLNSHEILHLAAAYFRREDFRAAAGSPDNDDPMEYTLWLMGLDGYSWWKNTPRTPRDSREQLPHDYRKSGFQVLGMGAGVSSHHGLFACAATHNHAHCDFASIEIAGFGRPLLTDTGVTSYATDDYREAHMHNLPALIRRKPLGPRIDNHSHASTGFVIHRPAIQAASMKHDLYENHRVRRTVCLIDADTVLKRRSDPRLGKNVFWVVIDRIDRTRPWPEGATIPHDYVETYFHFNAPGTELLSDPDTMTCWSVFNPTRCVIQRYPANDIHYTSQPEPVPLDDILTANEDVTSDANLQISAVVPIHRHSIMDMRFFEGFTGQYHGRVKRPSMAYRFQGLLPFDAAYVLVPFRGVRKTPYVNVAGRWTKTGTLSVTVDLPAGPVRFRARGLSDSRPQPNFTVTRVK